MAVSYVEPASRPSDADRMTDIGSSAPGGWLGRFLSACVTSCHALASRAEFDELSQEQLEDIGVTRFARRERWLDGRETLLPMGFEYRQPPGSSRSG